MIEPVLPDSAADPPIDLSETRAVIEQAKGILMATYRCGPDEALDLLRRASESGGLKVHTLATKVVDLAKRGLTITGARPQRPRTIPESDRPGSELSSGP